MSGLPDSSGGDRDGGHDTDSQMNSGSDADTKAWLPDGDSKIFRLYLFGPSGLTDYGSATLRCKI